MITEEAQTLESFIKDVKATVLNICSELKETIHKKKKKKTRKKYMSKMEI